MAAKFVLSKSKNGKFMFNLKAANGEPILSSEMYESKSGAKNGIESVKTNAPMAERYEKKASKKGEPYFVLKAGNNQVIGTSEMYSSESARDNGIASVKKNAPGAAVEDLA
ncbi:MAG: uncharacterized protein PWQ55_2321 [Chloroflexota bacterium]|nr:uncharacterized protein [Chloroflexota bacterium]